MTKQRNALKAGIFIIISVLLTFAITVAIKGTLIESMQTRIVSFSLTDDLSGLRVGDDVRIGGYKVGEVRRIEVVTGRDPRLSAPTTATTTPAPAEAIVVTMALPRRFDLRQGTRIGIQSTVTGQSCLNFSSLGQGELLAANTPLVGRPSPFAAVLAGLSDMSPELTGVLTQVNRQTVPKMNGVLDDVRGKTVPAVNATVASYKVTAESATIFLTDLRQFLKPIVEKYHKVGDSAVAMMDEIRALFGDTKTDFRQTVANLNSATDSIKKKLPPILDRVDGIMVKVDASIVSINQALEDVKKTVENTRDLTGTAKLVLAGNKGKIDGMITAMKATSENVKNATAELRHSPWRLLYKPGSDELANLNLYDTARQFAAGANDLNDAVQSLRDTVNNKQTDPAEIQTLMRRVQKSFEKFDQVEQKLWKEVKQ